MAAGVFGLSALPLAYQIDHPAKSSLVPLRGELCADVLASPTKVHRRSYAIAQFFFCLRSGNDSFHVSIPNPGHGELSTDPSSIASLKANDEVVVWVDYSILSEPETAKYPFSRIRAYGLEHEGEVLLSVDEVLEIWSANYWTYIKTLTVFVATGVAMIVLSYFGRQPRERRKT